MSKVRKAMVLSVMVVMVSETGRYQHGKYLKLHLVKGYKFYSLLIDIKKSTRVSKVSQSKLHMCWQAPFCKTEKLCQLFPALLFSKLP